MTTLHEFSANTLAGRKTDLSVYKGKVVLVVNTASRCGLTPQYAGLETLHRNFSGKGLVVLGFPCNQFGAQEPGSAEQIGEFCEKNYGVTFPMFEKIEVNGAGAHPLYQWLKKEAGGASGSEDIEWNFAKFPVGRDGRLIRRHEPKARPEDVAADLEALPGWRDVGSPSTLVLAQHRAAVFGLVCRGGIPCRKKRRLRAPACSVQPARRLIGSGAL